MSPPKELSISITYVLQTLLAMPRFHSNSLCKSHGFILDRHLTMYTHVSTIARTCYIELRRLASFRRFLTNTATATAFAVLQYFDI